MLKVFGQTALCLVCCVGIFIIYSCTEPSPDRHSFDITAAKGTPTFEIGLTRFKGNTFSVTLDGDAELFEGGRSVHSIQNTGPTTYEANWDGAAIRFDSYRGSTELKIVPRAGWFKIDKYAYHGRLILRAHKGALVLVNEVDLENYLAGSVGGEMSLLKTPREALKAQLIAARSYALYQRDARVVRSTGQPFDLYDDERSQMYLGMERETGLARELMNETRGMALVYNEEVVCAYYASTCGGVTEPAWQMLEVPIKIPPLDGVKCEYCVGSKNFEWTATYDKKDMAQKLAGKPGRVASLRISKRAKNGHAMELAFKLDGERSERVVPANSGFRHKLGTRDLRSTLFVDIKDLGDKFQIVGRGWGHAVGMCQVGAGVMASNGSTSQEILEYYYPGAKLKRIY